MAADALAPSHHPPSRERQFLPFTESSSCEQCELCPHGPGACSASEGCAGNPAPAVGSASTWRAEAGSRPGQHRRLQLTWCQVSPSAACRAVTGAVSREGLPAGQNWTPAVPTTPRPAGGLPAIRVTARVGPCPEDSPCGWPAVVRGQAARADGAAFSAE